MLVSICLPTIRPGSIAQAVDAVVRQTSPDWELLVVPQGGDPELLRILEEYSKREARIRVLALDRMNVNEARNAAIEAASGDVLAFTDDDCEVASDWVQVIIDEFTSHDDIGVLGGEVVAPRNPRWWVISTCPAAHVLDTVYYPSRLDYRAPHGFYMIGANIAVRREAASRIGQFDTSLGPGTPFPCCEEQDYVLRAESLDIAMRTTPHLIVRHTSGRRSGVRDVTKHLRNYARGRGAWTAKLQMWDHRLGHEWTRRPTPSEHLRAFAKQPDKWLLEAYAQHYMKRSAEEYRALYEIGDDRICRLRERPLEATSA